MMLASLLSMPGCGLCLLCSTEATEPEHADHETAGQTKVLTCEG